MISGKNVIQILPIFRQVDEFATSSYKNMKLDWLAICDEEPAAKTCGIPDFPDCACPVSPQSCFR